METEKMVEILLERIESAKGHYFDVVSIPKRYRDETEFAVAETRLITLECLAISFGIITTGTI